MNRACARRHGGSAGCLGSLGRCRTNRPPLHGLFCWLGVHGVSRKKRARKYGATGFEASGTSSKPQVFGEYCPCDTARTATTRGGQRPSWELGASFFVQLQWSGGEKAGVNTEPETMAGASFLHVEDRAIRDQVNRRPDRLGIPLSSAPEVEVQLGALGGQGPFLTVARARRHVAAFRVLTQ